MCKINVKDVPISDHKMLICRITLLKNIPNISGYMKIFYIK